MKAQTANSEMNTYFNLLTSEQKKSVVGLIKSFLKAESRINRKQYNIELEAAQKRIAKGKFISQDDLQRQSEKW